MDKVSEPRTITSQTPAIHHRPHIHSTHPGIALTDFDRMHKDHEHDFGILGKIAMTDYTVNALIHRSLVLIEFNLIFSPQPYKKQHGT